MIDVLHEGPPALSLWRIDPHWSSQFLMGHSNDLSICRISKYQHRGRCTNHMEMGEPAQPPLSLLWMRGDSSMSSSIGMRRKHGKGVHCFSHDHLYDVCMHPLTIHVQENAPRKSIHFSRPHGLVEAISMTDGHYFRGFGGEICCGGHAHFSTCIIHFPLQ